MTGRRAGVLFAAALPLLVRAQDPTRPEQRALLTKIQHYADTYTQQLQDFTCTQIMTRSGARAENRPGAAPKWKHLETQEIELNFVGHREHYRLLKVNGDARNPEKKVKNGYTRTSGEFGSMMRAVFDPKSRADFQWDHSTATSERKVCVYSYRVARENSSMGLRTEFRRIALAYTGYVSADCATGQILRIESDSEPDRSGFLIHTAIRYGPVTIADREFFLPTSVENISGFDRTLTKAEIRFENYRKYNADASIKFEDEVTEPPAKP